MIDDDIKSLSGGKPSQLIILLQKQIVFFTWSLLKSSNVEKMILWKSSPLDGFTIPNHRLIIPMFPDCDAARCDFGEKVCRCQTLSIGT